MNDVFHIKQGDLWPPLEAWLLQANGEPIPLQPSDVVLFIMTTLNRRNTQVIQSPVNIIDHEEAHIKYNWQAGDTEHAGSFQGEFHILMDGYKPVTVPNNQYFSVIIEHKLRAE